MDAPLAIEASGLTPGERVSISVASVDAVNVKWSSTAAFTANRRGVVDTKTSPAKSGSFTGVDRMGLLTFMHPAGSAPVNTAYRWSKGNATFRFELHIDGRVVYSAFVKRTAVAT
jgi:hypothetical protein